LLFKETVTKNIINKITNQNHYKQNHKPRPRICLIEIEPEILIEQEIAPEHRNGTRNINQSSKKSSLVPTFSSVAPVPATSVP